MRALIIGTDFIKDIDGSFKAIETNTNIVMDVEIPQHIDSVAFTNFVLNNGIEEIHLIHTHTNLEIFEDRITSDTPPVNFNKFLSQSIHKGN